MEVLAKTDLQDLYRITDGVLLVVNKFTYTDNNPCIFNGNTKLYNTKCQSGLKILRDDYNYRNNTVITKGTALYFGRVVEPTNNKSNWNFQIKTTGDSFSGDSQLIEGYIDNVLEIINSYRLDGVSINKYTVDSYVPKANGLSVVDRIKKGLV